MISLDFRKQHVENSNHSHKDTLLIPTEHLKSRLEGKLMKHTLFQNGRSFWYFIFKTDVMNSNPIILKVFIVKMSVISVRYSFTNKKL